MNKQEVVIKIGGEAGFGIKVAGLILGKTCFNAGLGVFGYSEYPSLIRGGHNVYQLNICSSNAYSATSKIDILIALNLETIEFHKDEINRDGVIVYDGLKLKEKDFKGINLIDIPLMDLAKKAGHGLTRNIVALGAAMYVLGLDLELFNKELKDEFGDKGIKVVSMNKKAAQSGYEYIKKNASKEIRNPSNSAGRPAQILLRKTYAGRQKLCLGGTSPFGREIRKTKERESDIDFIITANESTAYGMIQAGCKFYAAYPMTPSTSIMHVLAEKQRDFGLVVHQTEDEISAIGAAIGASITGVRAATGTSGGGFSLMTENLGLAAITETPLVVIESQRTAPATGLPTWTEQGDLKFAINASHGEFPRIVMAPGDAEEAFYMIQDAFNLAEKFQQPVIFLLDKLLSESDFVLEALDINKIKIKREGFLSDSELTRIKDYKRYEFTKDGISKRALPGQPNGVHVINSDDHDEYGFSTEESEMRIKMMDKRFRKVKLIEAELPEPKLYGPTLADLTIVGWGSVKGVVVDAIQELRIKNQELRVNFLHISYVWPFPSKRVKAVLEKAKNVLLVENNKTGQLGQLIREQTGFEIKNRLLKYDGRPFFREEVLREIKRVASTRL